MGSWLGILLSQSKLMMGLPTSSRKAFLTQDKNMFLKKKKKV